ncbi:MAG: response regulator [Chloroflexi bacterium]|nr:response regulator [Anaerolineaceae bacterium]NMB86848.1 response regulator [Chloroflexota bacterium]
MRILVVDDDDIALSVAEKVLKDAGHTVLLAENGEQALEVIHQEDIQVVISDWIMPAMDGIELCRRLRSSPVGYIYVIMVTARSSKEDLLTGLAAGADDFITKPFEPAELQLRIHNAERVLSLETTSLTLFSLAKLAESKDTDTGNHLERIRVYVKILAETLMADASIASIVPPRFPDLLFKTSPLHDIGKVGIPDYVLLKAGNLTDGEWNIMKRHAEIGADTLNAVLSQYPNAEFIRMARDIAWAHHERWDGSGYPRGLRGEEIPLSARIVAVADVYDALTMKRVYKAALSHDIARGMIQEESGKHFDPRVVQAFLQVEAQFNQIKANFPED